MTIQDAMREGCTVQNRDEPGWAQGRAAMLHTLFRWQAGMVAICPDRECGESTRHRMDREPSSQEGWSCDHAPDLGDAETVRLILAQTGTLTP